MTTKFRKGQLFFAGAPAGKAGLISSAILAAEQVGSEEESLYGHSAVVSNDTDELKKVTLLEMTFPRMREVNLLDYYKNSRFAIYDYSSLTEIDRNVIVNRLKKRLGERYGVTKIILYLIDYIINQTISKIFTFGKKEFNFVVFRRLHLFPGQVCSQVASSAYIDIYDFGISPDPDEMADTCRDNPDQFPLVHRQDIS